MTERQIEKSATDVRDAGGNTFSRDGSPLASPRATREVLEAFDHVAKYTLGQNFLVNNDVIRKILELADASPGDFILEVGPGIGTLTLGLLRAGASVVAIERDPDLLPVLECTCAGHANRLAVINADALDITFDQVKQAAKALTPTFPSQPADANDIPLGPDKLVANLPYGVAATVILAFLQTMPSLRSATVMVQKEVADRISARPGTKSYGAYTVKLRLLAQVDGRFAVGPGNFMPAPRVESAVIRLNRRPLRDEAGEPVPSDTLTAAALMADAAFASRRKTLANSCKTFFTGRGSEGKRIAERLPELFETADIDPRRRGETLDIDEFLRLGRALQGLAF